MKRILIVIPVLFIIAATTISCNGCRDKKIEHTDGASDGVSADGGYYDTDGNYHHRNGSANSTNSGSEKNAEGKSKVNKNGYSAPDGTDAENHDGDMYTKNDTTSMPSGPPIK